MGNFRIPVHLQDLGKSFAVKKWVDKKSFPLQSYFTHIDDFRRSLQVITENEPTNECLAAVLARTIDAEGSLIDHALASGGAIADEEAWAKISLSAAWVILQRYTTAVEKGEWPS